MALSDRDYVARRKKKRTRAATSVGRRKPGQRATWLGVNRAFMVGALIVVLLGLATWIASLSRVR